MPAEKVTDTQMYQNRSHWSRAIELLGGWPEMAFESAKDTLRCVVERTNHAAMSCSGERFNRRSLRGRAGSPSKSMMTKSRPV